MRDADEVDALGLRRLVHAADLPRLDGAMKENADLQVRLLRTDEEIAGLSREHDRVMRRVDALVAELGRGVA